MPDRGTDARTGRQDHRITVDTVEKHIERLYEKYDIRNAHGVMRLVVIGLAKVWEERATEQ